MEENTRPSTSIVWHHIKTSVYALAAIILAGWVTDALNEDLMLKIISRQFFPDEVANYEHPFSNLSSMFLWGIPLVLALLLMLGVTILTVHHIKKKHMYVVNKPKRLHSLSTVVLAVKPDVLPDALAAYAKADTVHILCDRKEAQEHIEQQIAGMHMQNQTQQQIHLHTMPYTEDLHTLVGHLNSVLHKILALEKKELAFDIKFAQSLFSSAAMYCSLETDVCLAYPRQDSIYEYETECVMES